MKAKTITPFIDKNTGIRYDVADIYESEDKERISFLQEEGFLGDQILDEPIEKSKGKKAKIKPPEETSSNE